MIRLTNCLRSSRTLFRKEIFCHHRHATRRTDNAQESRFSGLATCVQNQQTQNYTTGTSGVAFACINVHRRGGVNVNIGASASGVLNFIDDQVCLGRGNSIQVFDRRIRQFSSSPVTRKKEE